MRRTAARLGSVLLSFGLALGVVLAVPAAGLADQPTFGQPSAVATLGQPLSFTSTISGSDIAAVDVEVRLAGHDPVVVLHAQATGNPDEWQASAEVDIASSVECTCYATGPSAPNTRFEYQFEVHAADGSVTMGPLAQATVTDDRFSWQTLSDRMVVVHWYQGDRSFAQSAANVANDAIDKASQLLGVTLPQPVDLYVYATQQALLDAVSPNRENIAGEAHASIGTMFVWLPPDQPPSDQAVTVAHELTHLVFNQATQNPYHGPPRWLNEGIAVYLSEGYSLQWQAEVSSAVSSGSLIPLDGLAGLFPPGDNFYLAYGESVASVDYFIKTYGDQKLWALVRSYSNGLSDDDAFTQATGSNVEDFNAAWMSSLGVSVPPSFGPQPGLPGPVPSAWSGQPGGPVIGASPTPLSSNGQTAGPTARPTSPPEQPPGGSSTTADFAGALAIVFVIVLLVGVGLGAWLILRPRPRQPPWY